MANDNRTAETSGTADCAGYGLEYLENIRYKMLISTADALTTLPGVRLQRGGPCAPA